MVRRFGHYNSRRDQYEKTEGNLDWTLFHIGAPLKDSAFACNHRSGTKDNDSGRSKATSSPVLPTARAIRSLVHHKRSRSDRGLSGSNPLLDCAKNARTLHFLSIGFVTIEVEERIDMRSQAEPRPPEAIRFRSERFWSPKTALLDRLHSQDCAYIRFIFSDLQTRSGAGMGTPPPRSPVKL